MSEIASCIASEDYLDLNLVVFFSASGDVFASLLYKVTVMNKLFSYCFDNPE